MACKRRRWRGPKPVAFFMRVPCCQSCRSTHLPAARLRPSVGPPSPRNADAGRSRTDPHGWVSQRGKTGDPHRRCRTWAGCRRTPVVPGARRAGCRRTPVVPGARRAGGESREWASPGQRPVCRASSVHGRVPVSARRLPTPGPTWPVADAANRCFETFILYYAVALHHGPFGGAAKAGRWAALIPKYGCRTVAHRCPPLPNRDQRVPITTHRYRSAGKPAIHDAHAGHEPSRTDHHSWVSMRGKTGDP